MSPEQIAEAALAIGLERATIRSVARQLGMSVPGLYHHVRSRQQLIALAAAHGFAGLQLPDDHGQPWTEWLVEYGRFVYDALVAQPELVGQILAGTVDTLRQAQHLERFFEVLERQGFEIGEAYLCYARLTAAVIGAAASEIGRRAAAQAGHATLSELRRAARALGADAVPRVRGLLDAPPESEPDPFDSVRLTVRGIAQERADRPAGGDRSASRSARRGSRAR